MTTFTCDLDRVVSVLLAASRAKDSGISAAEAVKVLADAGIDVPGDEATAQAMNIRAVLAWVNPAVGGNKRGPGGGFVPAEKLAPKEKKAQGVNSLVGKLKAQGVTEESIREMLSQVHAQAVAEGRATPLA